MRFLLTALLTLCLAVAAPAQVHRSTGVGASYNAASYGIMPSAGDQTARIQALLQRVYDAGGGTIEFGAGVYRIDGQIVWPKDSTAPQPRTKPIVVRGAGAFMTSTQITPSGGTIWDMRDTTAPAKIDLRGVGRAEISGICFDSRNAASSTNFIQTTNTTVFVHDCGFFGRTTSPYTGCDEDAIVLGGANVDGTIDGDADAPFQGYGAVFERNWFQRIRRAFYLRTFCNGVVFSGNTVWNQCGGEAAIESESFHGTESNAGNVFIGNLIECPNYTYAVKLTQSTMNVFIGNNFYDPSGAGFTSFYYLAADALYTTIIDGYHPDNETYVTDLTAGSKFNRITTHQGQYGQTAEKHKWLLNNWGDYIFSNAYGQGPIIEDNANWHQWGTRAYGAVTPKLSYEVKRKLVAGTLTKTSATEGSLAVATGHGVATGNTVDLAWTGGSRVGVTVGTVDAPPNDTTIPVSGGTGNDLPVDGTSVAVRTNAVESYASIARIGAGRVGLQFESYASTSGDIVGPGNIRIGSSGSTKDIQLGSYGTERLVLGIPATLAAAGSAQGDAASITDIVTVITVSAPGQGVKLPTAAAGLSFWLINSSGTDVNLYPNTSDEVNNAGANTAIVIPANTACSVHALDAVDWFTIPKTPS